MPDGSVVSAGVFVQGVVGSASRDPRIDVYWLPVSNGLIAQWFVLSCEQFQRLDDRAAKATNAGAVVPAPQRSSTPFTVPSSGWTTSPSTTWMPRTTPDDPPSPERGTRTIGLLYYLYGPGTHEEHIDPHPVAAWEDCAPDPGHPRRHLR